MNKKNEIINYLVFGVLTTFINIVSYALFTKIMNMDYRIATTIAWFVSVIFAFITNKIYVFNSREMRIQTMTTEFLSFMFFRVLSYLTDLGIMIFLVEWISINDVIAKILANVVVVIINYVASKYFIFRSTKQS